MKIFDIVMVLEYFRPLTYYLSIIRYLGDDYNIGLYAVDIPSRQHDKNIDTQNLFEKTCTKFGAKIIREEEIQTEILLIPQNVYTEIARKDINNNIKANKKIGVLGFAWAGVKVHDEFLDVFAIDKLFVIDKSFTTFLLEQRKVDTYQEKTIVETGLPFKKYPIFENLAIDYLLVMPTSFSFPHEKDKWMFLETIKTLFSQIDDKDIVVHKPHNGMYTDLFATERYMKLIRIIRYIPMISDVLKILINISSGFIKKITSKLYTAYIYRTILERTVPLSSISKYSSFAVEAFLPNVRKGVIGGLSNTIWGTLYHQIPFYNAVDMNIQNRSGPDRLYGNRDSFNLIDLNLKYFFIPFCEKKLEFDLSYFSIVDNCTRSADLLDEIKNELQYVDEKDKSYVE
jgi:hypothetical protein